MTLTPVQYSAAQLTVIANVCPGGVPTDSSVWAADSVTGLKESIKAHYIAAQSSTCCYCDRHLGSENHRIWDVDHVVPRSTHPHFTFEPRNLVASCVDCNIAKRDARVLNNNRRKTYPKTSADFRILHPHFDQYTEHILRRGYFYVGKTLKGKQTIYSCDLLRYAQKYIDWSNSIADDRFEADVADVLSGGARGAAAAQRIADLLR